MRYNSVFGFVLRKIKKELREKELMRGTVLNERYGRSYIFAVLLDTEHISTEEQKRIFIPVKIFVPLCAAQTMDDTFPKEKFRAMQQTLENINLIYGSVWKYSGELFITVEVPEKRSTKEQIWEEVKNDFTGFYKRFKKVFNDRKTYFLSKIKENNECIKIKRGGGDEENKD